MGGITMVPVFYPLCLFAFAYLSASRACSLSIKNSITAKPYTLVHSVHYHRDYVCEHGTAPMGGWDCMLNVKSAKCTTSRCHTPDTHISTPLMCLLNLQVWYGIGLNGCGPFFNDVFDSLVCPSQIVYRKILSSCFIHQKQKHTFIYCVNICVQ